MTALPKTYGHLQAVSLNPAPKWNTDAILASVAQQARDLEAGAVQREQQRILPLEAFAKIRESGLGALLIPTQWGGPGGTLVDATQAILTLAEGDSNVPHALRLHFNQTQQWRIRERTPDAFIRQQISRVLEGKLFGGASTEQGTAKPGQVTTQLSVDGDHWRLNGRKYYSTGTLYADFATISALDEHGQPATVVLPVAREGLEIRDDWDGFGQRLTASGSLILNNVQVHADELRRESSLQLGLVSRHTSAWRQLILVATAGGIVRALLRDIQGYVLSKGRAALHSPAEQAKDDPFIQHVIGDVAANSHAIDVLILETARTLENGAQAIERGDAQAEAIVLQGGIATAKTQLIVGKLALYAAQQAFEAGGASATSRSLSLDRHWRNLRTIFNHNPLGHKTRVLGDWHLNGNAQEFENGRVF